MNEHGRDAKSFNPISHLSRHINEPKHNILRPAFYIKQSHTYSDTLRKLDNQKRNFLNTDRRKLK